MAWILSTTPGSPIAVDATGILQFVISPAGAGAPPDSTSVGTLVAGPATVTLPIPASGQFVYYRFIPNSGGGVVLNGGSGSSSAGADVVMTPIAISISDTQTNPNGGNGFIFVASSVGNMKVGWPNGMTLTFPVLAPGLYQYSWGINQIFNTGTTAAISGTLVF